MNFNVLSTFPPAVVFSAPTVTSHLFETHRQFYKELKIYHKFANELYFPECWIPHCTFAIGLNKDSLLRTFEHCLNQFQPFDGQITEIGIVKIEFVDGIHSSKTIFAKRL